MKSSEKPAWSPRSQRSVLEQRRLAAELEKCERLILDYGTALANFEKAVEIHTGFAVRGDAIADANLPGRLQALADRKAQLAAYKEYSASLQKKIAALALSPSQAARRTELQACLAALAGERLEKDLRLEWRVEHLRQLLQERVELTSKMCEIAAACDLTVLEDGFDELRFKNLLDSLPANFAAASERWLDWFLGRGQKKAYIVRQKARVLPETLASPHVYHSGDQVELTEEQVRDLLSRSPRNAQAIVTLEAHQAASLETEKSAVST